MAVRRLEIRPNGAVGRSADDGLKHRSDPNVKMSPNVITINLLSRTSDVDRFRDIWIEFTYLCCALTSEMRPFDRHNRQGPAPVESGIAGACAALTIGEASSVEYRTTRLVATVRKLHACCTGATLSDWSCWSEVCTGRIRNRRCACTPAGSHRLETHTRVIHAIRWLRPILVTGNLLVTGQQQNRS